MTVFKGLSSISNGVNGAFLFFNGFKAYLSSIARYTHSTLENVSINQTVNCK